MKIMDENGRLFGKINIIDFLVLLFLLSLIPMFYLGHRIYARKSPEVNLQVQEPKQPKQVEQPSQFSILVYGKFTKLEPETLKMISVGDREKDSTGTIIGEVVSIGKPSPYTSKFDIGTIQELIREDPDLKQVEAELKINVAVIDRNIYYKDRAIMQGKSIDFCTERYSVQLDDLNIMKDNHNTVVSKQVMIPEAEDNVRKDNIRKDNIREDNIREDNIRKDIELQLSILEKKIEVVLVELMGRVNQLEAEMSQQKKGRR